MGTSNGIVALYSPLLCSIASDGGGAEDTATGERRRVLEPRQQLMSLLSRVILVVNACLPASSLVGIKKNLCYHGFVFFCVVVVSQ